MKRWYIIFCAWVICLTLAACGNAQGEKQSDTSLEYYSIETTEKEIGSPAQNDGRWQLLCSQFYQGEAVQIWYVKDETSEGAGLMDVYLYRQNGSTELLVGGISQELRGSWYLDGSGDIYILSGKKLTRMDKDGQVLYSSTAKSDILDICQMADGTFVLLVETDTGVMRIALLDAESGEVKERPHIKLEESTAQYICAGEEDLVLLDTVGVWSVDLGEGSRESLLDFAKASYQLDLGLSDLRIVDGENVELLYNGKVESLRIETVTQEKAVIVVRNWYDNPYVREAVEAFNAQSDRYHVALEVPAALKDSAEFITQTNLQIVSGEGPDIMLTGVIEDVESYIEKGLLEDLKPYMDASGIKEEDYFPIAFESYRDGDKIYSILDEVGAYGFCMDKSLTGDAENPAIETVVEALLNAPKETIIKEHYTARKVLKYFLEGSESLLGMIDWETRTCDFDSELFVKLLEASKLHGYDERYSYTELAYNIADGNFFTFETKSDLDSKGMTKVGNFFDDGCHVTNNASDVWVMNSNSENKEGAWEFLKFLLSEEYQTSWDASMYPTNRKAFEKMAEREMVAGPIEAKNGSVKYKAGTEYYRTHGEEAYIARFTLTTEKVDEIRTQLENTRALPYRIEPLLEIILEEADHYFNDAKTIEEILPIIENRVQLYLDEHN